MVGTSAKTHPDEHLDAKRAPLRPVRMGPGDVEVVRRPDGSLIARSPHPLGPYATRLTDRLDHWAAVAPDRLFLADRGPDGAWRRLTYAEVRQRARAIAQALLDRDLSPERPIVILSGNSIEHALIAFGSLYAGVPHAPVSPAYSLVSSDFGKLRHVFRLLTPGLALVADGAPFANALRAVTTPETELVVARNAPDGLPATPFDALLATPVTEAVDAATARVGPDTIAKFLFTSGSTGMPKAVINTQRMWCANQVMLNTLLAFLKDEPVVLLDWLPWNHTAGGNHDSGLVLYNGGTLYIDDGSPTPAGIERTVRNLRDVAPTFYLNVPKGFDALCEHFARDDALCRHFFSRLKLMLYAGAGLARHTWDRLEELAVSACGERIRMITGYGSTETAPFAFTSVRPTEGPGIVGIPAPGIEAKLVPNEGKLELRLKGPNIFPGYWRQPEETAKSFDEEGFYEIGDALRFVDECDPEAGFVFDGRIAEDFKLDTGTWVNFATVRAGLIAGFAPFAKDVVLAGHNQPFLSALIFPDVAACAGAAGLTDADEAKVAENPAVRALFQERLDRFAAAATGSSNRVERIVILAEPASIDRHEMTDKGSINQRAVLANRADIVAGLYAEPPPTHVLDARRTRG